MKEEYQPLCQRTIEHLKQAQIQLQASQRSIGTAIRFNAINGNERKLLSRVKIDLVDPIEQIESVIIALKISIQ